MAPIKFEEQIKDKLEKRNLSPSKDSWSKLSDRLDAEEKQTKRPVYWWLGVAAGLVILLAVTIQFFNKNEKEKTMPIIAEEQVEDTNKKPLEKQLNTVENKNLAEENTFQDSLESINKPQINEYKKVTKIQPKIKKQLAETKKINKTNTKIINKPQKPLAKTTDEALIKTAIASVLNELKSNNTEVADREADSLLKLASKELFRDKLKEEATQTVNAEALLQSVENDMGQSFRSKVFEALKESYETVKSAVADRNN